MTTYDEPLSELLAAFPPDAIGTAEIVATTDGMDRPEWLDLRRRGIGGSDAAAICGLSRFASPFEVWLSKTDAPMPDEDNEAMLWGRLLEDVVADEVARREGVDLVRANVLLAHHEHSWMLANIDRAAYRDGEQGIYEGKTAGVWTGAEWDDNAVPEAYVVQGMHYLAVTGLPWLLYGVLIGGQRLEVRRVDRDEALIASLVKIEQDFWQSVLDGTPPDPDGSKACTEFVAGLYEVKPGTEVILDGDVANLLADRAEAKADEKAAKERGDSIDNRLKLLIGEAETARSDDDGRVLFTYKGVPASSYTVNRKAHRRLYVPEVA